MQFKERLCSFKRSAVSKTLECIEWISKTRSGNNHVFSALLLSVVWLSSYWLGIYGSIYKWTIVPVVFTSLLIIFRVGVWWLYTSKAVSKESEE